MSSAFFLSKTSLSVTTNPLMKLSDLDFTFPESLIATEPRHPSRVLWVENDQAEEITKDQLLLKIPAGDVLVLNDTKVLKRRVFTQDGLEILFLSQNPANLLEWSVLFPSKKFQVDQQIRLPLGMTLTLTEKGRPQKVSSESILSEDYFQAVAELPLPPYIQKMRDSRHTVLADESWYQTAWAEKPGSLASPTASLHFNHADIESLKSRGVKICHLTLHVGLGTFLPVQAEDLNDHVMHAEMAEIPKVTLEEITKAKHQQRKIWALGTTVVRSLESVALNKFQKDSAGHLHGATDLLIQPGFQFQVVDRMLTNFHQPKSTLLALVSAFAGLDSVKKHYQTAIDKQFRLFSYGDLSVWIK